MTQCREQRELDKLKQGGTESPPHCPLSQTVLARPLQLPAPNWGDIGAMQGQAPCTDTLVTHRGCSSGWTWPSLEHGLRVTPGHSPSPAHCAGHLCQVPLTPGTPSSEPRGENSIR